MALQTRTAHTDESPLNEKLRDLHIFEIKGFMIRIVSSNQYVPVKRYLKTKFSAL